MSREALKILKKRKAIKNVSILSIKRSTITNQTSVAVVQSNPLYHEARLRASVGMPVAVAVPMPVSVSVAVAVAVPITTRVGTPSIWCHHLIY